jgi:hypothetical protein
MSDRTVLNPQYATTNSLNSLFSGSGSIDLGNVLANKVTIDSTNNDNDYSLTCYSNTLSIGCPATITPSVQIGNSNQYVQLKCPSTNILKIPSLQLANSTNSVLIQPLSAPNYIGLVDTATNTNTASVQGGTFNALTSVTTPLLNLFATNGDNTNITFNGTGDYINVPSSMYVNKSMSAGNFTGGLYSGQFTTNPPRSVPPSGTSQYVFNIPWNPAPDWTVDTVIPLFTFTSDYPTVVNSYALVANGVYQIQISLNVSNGSGTQSSNIYAINYLIMNNA